MGLAIAAELGAQPRREQFEQQVAAGELRVSEEGRIKIEPHPSGNVFRVAVGVTSEPVPEGWSVFDQRYQWFGREPQAVTSGAHLFVLAVGRWRSAVVGLYEAVTAGAAKLPNSPNPDRWPWALGVRPLAAILPPLAERVPGQQGPQSGLPAHVYEAEAQEQLYRAVAASDPPPGPHSLEQKVQELERQDVLPDVIEAVRGLGKEARKEAIVERAIDLGGWTDEELQARAWYTGNGSGSHIEQLIDQILRFEIGSKGRLQRTHGIYSVGADVPVDGFGVSYRRAKSEQASQDEELPSHVIDLSELDRATQRHMELQDHLADALRQRGVEPRSPGGWQPQFDLGFESACKRFVVEVKSGDPVTQQQVRLGVGQVLEYRHLLAGQDSREVEPVLLVESEPPPPWAQLAEMLGVCLLRADQLEQGLSELL